MKCKSNPYQVLLVRSLPIAQCLLPIFVVIDFIFSFYQNATCYLIFTNSLLPSATIVAIYIIWPLANAKYILMQ